MSPLQAAVYSCLKHNCPVLKIEVLVIVILWFTVY